MRLSVLILLVIIGMMGLGLKLNLSAKHQVEAYHTRLQSADQ